MSQEDDAIRTAGASTRKAMFQTYQEHGPRVGLRFARRYLWEIGEVMAEVHGPNLASRSAYYVADAIATRGDMVDLLTNMEDEKPVDPLSPSVWPAVRSYVGWGAIVLISFFCGWSAHS